MSDTSASSPENAPAATTNAGSGGRTKGILSLVFGIISIVFSLFLPIIWVFFGIAAVILGFLSRHNEPRASKLALAGIITGFIGIALCITSMVLGALFLAEYAQNVQ